MESAGSRKRSMNDLSGERISVIGLGASGFAAARLALANGGEVYVSDLRDEPGLAARGDELESLGARVELGDHRLERLADSDTVVVSPGIPPDAPVLQRLRSLGVRWISEPEFAFRFLDGPLIAVTGTNGKTTTAALTAHLLRESGRTVGLGGNIGAAFGPAASALALLEPAPEWFVVEVSSFQLADIQRFAPAIGVVTNLAPDHLDRYADLESYYRDKARLFDTATSSSRWVLCHDNPAVCALPGDAPGERFYFSTETTGITGGYVSEGRLTLRLEEEEESLLPADELPLLGVHNTANALAAAVTAALAGAPSGDIASALRDFRPLPHRLEPVVERDGVLWVNDSKATNVSAAHSALASLDRPLVVLLGGKDKGEDFRLLLTLLRERARIVVAYGASGPRIHQELGGVVNVVLSEGTFEDAVAVAAGEALAGDVLLLSPACSSFDMFEDYEARGECFSGLARGAD